MILIHIKKEDREPEVGEAYDEYFSSTISLRVYLDMPNDHPGLEDTEWIDDIKNLVPSFPISNSEEIFQWLHDNGKLGEEWVEWEGDHKVRAYWGGKKDEVYLPVWPNKPNENPLKEQKCQNKDKCTCRTPLIRGECPNLSCDETYTNWSNRLFTHMAECHDLNLTDTELQDIYDCIIKFNPEKETRRLKN